MRIPTRLLVLPLSSSHRSCRHSARRSLPRRQPTTAPPASAGTGSSPGSTPRIPPGGEQPAAPRLATPLRCAESRRLRRRSSFAYTLSSASRSTQRRIQRATTVPSPPTQPSPQRRPPFSRICSRLGGAASIVGNSLAISVRHGMDLAKRSGDGGQRLGEDVARRVTAWAPPALSCRTLERHHPKGPGMWYSAPGVPPIGIGYDATRPWLLDSVSQFRPAPPRRTARRPSRRRVRFDRSPSWSGPPNRRRLRTMEF